MKRESPPRLEEIVLRDWFPPNDFLAATIATAIIVREDLFIAQHAVREPAARGLLKRGQATDALKVHYYLRRLLTSLQDAKNCLAQLLKHPNAAGTDWAPTRQVFNVLAREFDKKAPLKDHRDALGGHVERGRVQEGLATLPSDEKVQLLLGGGTDKTRFLCAANLCILTFLRGVPNAKWEEKLSEIVRTTSSLALVAIPTLDHAIWTYARQRGVLPDGFDPPPFNPVHLIRLLKLEGGP